MGRFTDRICDFWDNAERLLEDQSKWSQATFGTDQERKPIGALKHLAKEAIEAVDAVEADDRTAIEEEFADCFLLLMDAARRANLGGGDFGDGGMGCQGFFDLDGADTGAARVHHVVAAPFIADCARGPPPPDVTCQVPVPQIAVFGVLWRVQVPQHQAGIGFMDRDLAAVALRSVLLQQCDAPTGLGLPERSRIRGGGRATGYESGTLRHPIRLINRGSGGGAPCFARGIWQLFSGGQSVAQLW